MKALRREVNLSSVESKREREAESELVYLARKTSCPTSVEEMAHTHAHMYIHTYIHACAHAHAHASGFQFSPVKN